MPRISNGNRHTKPEILCLLGIACDPRNRTTSSQARTFGRVRSCFQCGPSHHLIDARLHRPRASTVHRASETRHAACPLRVHRAPRGWLSQIRAIQRVATATASLLRSVSHGAALSANRRSGLPIIAVYMHLDPSIKSNSAEVYFFQRPVFRTPA